jgi:hypothetical protein
MDLKELEIIFGSRSQHLAHQLLMLSTTGQPCDVTFYKHKPLINVTVDSKLGLAIMYGAGEKSMLEMFHKVSFSDGTIVDIREIWTVNPMPNNGFSDDELNSVKLSEGDEKIDPNGETLRKMISDTYHCSSSKEEDYYLRRFLAS